jgi:uncharacterized protein YqgC (DUF456 family)
MGTALAITGWTAFVIAVLIGILLDVVGLFGNWVILLALGIVWVITGFEHFGIPAVVVMVALAILGEILEFAAAGYGAKRFGASRGAVLAALVGCIAGAVFGTPWFPVVGTLIGACVGAFIGAAGHELLLMQQETGRAMKAGFGAALGKIGGIMAKMAAGIIMLGIAALTY